MRQSSVIAGMFLLLLGGAVARTARAEGTSAWEDERRTTLRDQLSETFSDIVAGPPRFYWKRGPVLQTRGEALSFHLGYEGQFDATWYGGMGKAVEAAARGKWLSGFEVRRSRLLLEGFVLRYWYFRARYDTSGFDEPRFEDLFIEWSGLTRFGDNGWPTIRVGQVKEPMTMDWMNSALRTTFAERAMVTTSIVPNRNPGIRLHGTGFGRRMTYQVGGFLVNAAQLNQIRPDEGESITARITGLPWAPEKRPGHLLHLGLSTSWRWNVGTTEFSSPPESHLGPNVVDTGEFAASRSEVYAAEAFFQRDRFSILAEGAWNRALLPDGRRVDYMGWHAQVSYFLTQTRLPYDRGLGVFGRLRPERTLFCPAKSGLGAWEIAARYSFLDLDSGPHRGGSVWNVTLGLNWYARDNMRVALNYIYTDVDDAFGVAGADGTMNTLLLRFQYDL